MQLRIEVKKIKDNLYIASCPNLRGCHVQAESEAIAVRRIREATRLMVLSYKKHFEKVPFER